MDDDYQIYEQDQWFQSPSHSKAHLNYVSSNSSLWGYSVDDNQEHLVDKWSLVGNVEAIHWGNLHCKPIHCRGNYRHTTAVDLKQDEFY